MAWDEKQEVLQTIYRRFEREAALFKKDAVCRLGCTFCCTDVGNVDINTLEGLVIRNTIKRLSRIQRRDLEKGLATNRQQKQKQSSCRCAFLAANGACVIYDVRPFSCRQLYSLHACDGRGPVVHRQAVVLVKKAIRDMQQLDDTGYSGHLSYVLHLLDDNDFRATYLAGVFNPSQIMDFGKAHGMVINRFVDRPIRNYV
jgi:hypothetical protein